MGRVNTILGMVLSFAFIMAGSQKITPTINPEVHEYLATNAKSWGPVWVPLFRKAMSTLGLDEQTGAVEKLLLDDGSKTYAVMLTNIGYLECVCAAMLLSSLFSGIATILLICTMGGAIYTHLQLDQPFVPPAALLTLLVIKLILPGGDASSAEKGGAKPKKKPSTGRSKKD